MYFFSVNDVPRDNGTAGACRNRHHGGGKTAHAALREAAARNYERDTNSYYRRQFLRSFIARLSLCKKKKKGEEEKERKTGFQLRN